MSLLDSQIRKNLTDALERLEKDIMDFELPLSQFGYEGSEYFIEEGTFGKKSGEVRHWVALIVFGDDKDRIDSISQFVSGKS